MEIPDSLVITPLLWILLWILNAAAFISRLFSFICVTFFLYTCTIILCMTIDMPGSFSDLLPKESVETLVKAWLAEDIPNFDYGGFAVGEKHKSAQLLLKSPGVVAGIPFFDAVFHQVGCQVEWTYGLKEGDYFNCENPKRIAVVKGFCKDILQGERVALNCLCRASGIATLTKRYVDEAHKQGMFYHEPYQLHAHLITSVI